MAETRIHPETGEELTRGVRPMLIQYGSLFREVEVPGWYPEGEGDAIHSGADLRDADEAYAQLREEYSAHVREVRERLDLTQEEAGEVIGGGRRAFNKYESGKAPPSDAAVGLIEVLWEQPEALEILRSIRRQAASGQRTKKAGRQRRERATA